MAVNYVIVEDEALAAERLQAMVKEKQPGWILKEVIPSVRLAVAKLELLKPDLIFLDVHLADGNSFAIFDQVSPKAAIIFTTAYDKYALKAFSLNSIDYLLKPISNDDLNRAIAKFEQRSLHNSHTPDWKSILQDFQPNYKDRFMVSTGERIKSLPVDEVSFFYAQGKHTFITDKSGREYLIDHTLTKLSEVLNPKKFFQINRQYIVAFDCISEMIAYSKGRLKLITNPITPGEAIVSVDKSPRFKAWLEGE